MLLRKHLQQLLRRRWLKWLRLETSFGSGSEEVPSAPLQKAIAQFNKLVVSGQDSGLSFEG